MNNEVISIILSMAPAITSVVSIAVGVTKVVRGSTHVRAEMSGKFSAIMDHISEIEKRSRERSSKLDAAINEVLTENAKLKHELAEERQKRTGVKE